MTSVSEIMDNFFAAAGSLRNPYVEEWMRHGGKVIGYYCSYMPEEIITAAGFMPYRIRAVGSGGTSYADAYMSSVICSFSRHSLDLAVRGEFDFLDGAIWSTTCDHIRRTIDYWKKCTKVPFLYLLPVPKMCGEDQVEKFKRDMAVMIHNIEKEFHVEITENRLRQAIRLHNEKRALLREIYDLRKAEIPVLTGTEAMAISVAGSVMPVEPFNKCLRQLLAALPERKCDAAYPRTRLMLVGSELDDPQYIKNVEEMGACVVTDSLCFGSRFCWVDVDEQGDPLTALAQHHIRQRPSCPRLFAAHDRQIGYVLRLAEEYRVDGVISERLRFCDHWTCENIQLSEALAEKGIPFMAIDREYRTRNLGQMKTRVQAFLETVEGRVRA